MDNQPDIINRVTQSTLVTIDLEEYYHHGERVVYDIKDNLFQGLALKEKEFRAFVKEYDWSQFKDKNVAIICSTEAIVPTWAYMLLSVKISSFAHRVIFGNLMQLEQALFQEVLYSLNIENYKDKKVVIKGCSKFPVPQFAYVELTRLLVPIASSIMFGEPCSTVPLFKRPLSK